MPPWNGFTSTVGRDRPGPPYPFVASGQIGAAGRIALPWPWTTISSRLVPIHIQHLRSLCSSSLAGQRTTLRLQIPHRPPHRCRTPRRTRTRTPHNRTETERRQHMTQSKSGIQNSPSRATTISPRNYPARPVRGFPAFALFAGALAGRSMSFDAIS